MNNKLMRFFILPYELGVAGCSVECHTMSNLLRFSGSDAINPQDYYGNSMVVANRSLDSCRVSVGFHLDFGLVVRNETSSASVVHARFPWISVRPNLGVFTRMIAGELYQDLLSHSLFTRLILP